MVAAKEDAKENNERETVERAEGTKKIRDKKAQGMIRRKKVKKEKPMATALYLLVESGKIEFGGRRGLKNAAGGGKIKAFVIAKNAPKELRDDITKYCKINNTRLMEFDGSTMELGSACGKPYPISVLSIFDVGTSNILDL